MRKSFLFFVCLFFFAGTVFGADFPNSSSVRVLSMLQKIKGLTIETSRFPTTREVEQLNSLGLPFVFEKTGSYPTTTSSINCLNSIKSHFFVIKNPNYPSNTEIRYLAQYSGEKKFRFLFNQPSNSAIRYILESTVKNIEFDWYTYPGSSDVSRLRQLPSFSINFLSGFPGETNIQNLNQLPLTEVTFLAGRAPSTLDISRLNRLACPINFRLINPSSRDLELLNELKGLKSVIITIYSFPTNSMIRDLNEWGRKYTLEIIGSNPYPTNTSTVKDINSLTGVTGIVFRANNFPFSSGVDDLNQLNNPFQIHIEPNSSNTGSSFTAEVILQLDLTNASKVSEALPEIIKSPVAIKNLFREKVNFELLHSADRNEKQLLSSYLDELK